MGQTWARLGFIASVSPLAPVTKAGPLAKQDAVARLDVEGDEAAILVVHARTDAEARLAPSR
jgi:hypothetical protein